MTGAAGQDGQDADAQGVNTSVSARQHFGNRLATAAHEIVADTRQALARPELTDAEAVHEVRKALKRWRAFLRLLTEPLGQPADQMRVAARELMRSLAGARDAQSALDALADLGKTAVAATPTLSATSLANIETRLKAIRDAAEWSLKSRPP